MTATTRTRYDAVAITLHWLTAVLMIVMMLFGEEMMESAEDMDEAGEALGALGGSLHVSIGAAILLLTVVRLVWRVLNPPPSYPVTMAGWEKLAAGLTHGLFYVLLIAIPLTGWLAFGDFAREEAGAAAIRLFGLFEVPAAPVTGSTAKELHEIGSNAALVLTILHVLAALKHQFISRDGMLGRMLPH